jgi:plasmid stabilization system protein ParE
MERGWQSAPAAIAERIGRGIYDASAALAEVPENGGPRLDIRRGLRAVHAFRYVAFYRITKTGVEIVRVLDERRDVELLSLEE